MIRQVVNINGTSRADLIKQRTDVMAALYNAIDALKQGMPNGRDYPNDKEQCVADRQKQYGRIATLNAMRDELLEEALLIQNGDKT